jgi:hypothetical protein
MADTMVRFSDDNLSTNFLTMDELKARCPYAFKETPTNPNVSSRYIQANTSTVVSDLEKLGWLPVEAKQCRAKKNSSGIRSFHLIAFQNPDVKITTKNEDGTETVDSYPRIILTNGHDGFNSFKFRVGMFRLVCSNGLVVATDEFADLSIKHINYDFETLREIVKKTISEIPNIVCTMNEMKKVTVTDEQKIELAKSVVRIRKNIDNNDVKIGYDDDMIRDILNPLRKSDTGNDLWSVFNVCQEKLIRGGYYALNNKNKPRKQKKITSIRKEIEYNQKLWSKAMELMPAMA